MKIFRFVFFLAHTIIIFVALNFPIGDIPPLGKLLSPHQGYLQNAETHAIDLPNSLKLEGISGSVTVQFDEQMIPHIFASTREDLHFAQGYVTAYHRLWQMDFYSRVVFGRISEIVGDKALAFDRENRRIGLKKMTEDFHDVLMQDEEMKRLTEAYTAGVNAYISQLSRADYPLEFKLLDYSPEPWTTLKSCMAYGLLCNTLSKGESDLENTNALTLFGEDMFNVLFPDQLGNLSPIIPAGTKWDFDPIPAENPQAAMPLALTPHTLKKPDRIFGSNNFTVNRAKSKSGHPLLANEPDLQLTIPSIWYVAHLNAPGINAMGVTVPGTMPLLIGFNDSIAWGFTNSPRDQVDWYSIRFKDNQRDEYEYNGQWFKTEKIVEKIKIKGGKDFYDTIVYVHQGPVVYDRNFLGKGGKINYAMQWMAHRENTTYTAMYKLNTARNYDDYTQALTYFTGPPQNAIFASVDGDIAIRAPGRFPVKWPGQGKFLLDGTKPTSEWKNIIPFEHQMFAKNPSQGFLSSANQHQVDTLYPYYVYDYNFEFYRNRRINDRLRIMNNITPTDMIKLQNDNFNYIASEALPAMLGNIDSTALTSEARELFSQLSRWDYFNEPELKSPTLFQIWWDLMYDQIWDEFDTVSVKVIRPTIYTTTYLINENPGFDFFDKIGTEPIEQAGDIINQSFFDMVDSLQKWKTEKGESYEWYIYKNTEINHLLGIQPFSKQQIKIGGNNHIVNAAGKTAGPSWRMVVELNPDGVQAWGVYPGSQSGNPGNPMYAHMIENWATGNYYSLLFTTAPSQTGIIYQSELKPN